MSKIQYMNIIQNRCKNVNLLKIKSYWKRLSSKNLLEIWQEEFNFLMVDFYLTDHPPCLPFPFFFYSAATWKSSQFNDYLKYKILLLQKSRRSVWTVCWVTAVQRYSHPKPVCSYYKKQLREQMSFILLPVLSAEFWVGYSDTPQKEAKVIYTVQKYAGISCLSTASSIPRISLSNFVCRFCNHFSVSLYFWVNLRRSIESSRRRPAVKVAVRGSKSISSDKTDCTRITNNMWHRLIGQKSWSKK